MKSLSEIETTVKRATKAAGYSWGVSEETGKCIRLLELFNLPGVKHLNQYFNDRKKNKFEKLNLISEKNSSSQNAFCPIILGVSFMDNINRLENIKKIEIENIAYPIIFLSFLSRSSEIIGKRLNVEMDKKKILLNLNLNICTSFISSQYPKIVNKININFLDNKDSFTADEWKNLYKLSEDTFVEETENLKNSAAGAGLTDND